MRIARSWRRGSRKGGETGRRRATSMVRAVILLSMLALNIAGRFLNAIRFVLSTQWPLPTVRRVDFVPLPHVTSVHHVSVCTSRFIRITKGIDVQTDIWILKCDRKCAQIDDGKCPLLRWSKGPTRHVPVCSAFETLLRDSLTFARTRTLETDVSVFRVCHSI